MACRPLKLVKLQVKLQLVPSKQNYKSTDNFELEDNVSYVTNKSKDLQVPILIS